MNESRRFICILCLLSVTQLSCSRSSEKHDEESKGNRPIVEHNKDKTPVRASSQKSRNSTECLIILDFLERVDLHMRVYDKKLIQEIIYDPIANARLDPEPAAYEILGGLSIEAGSSEGDYFTLFIPWGHYKKDDQYFIADFTRLQQYVLKRLKSTIELID